jgi:acetyl-CoA carboxylase biotin carboxyl carrier protein
MRQDKPKDKPQVTEQDHSGVLKLVEQLAEILERTDLTEVRIRENDLEVQVSRHPRNPGKYDSLPLQPTEASVAVSTQTPPVEAGDVEGSEQAQSNNYINAPMPSRFYRAPSPEEPPFVEVGDLVSVGEPVAVLEVMKTYNPVEAPFNCEILEILAEDGDAVEYAQPLLRVKPQ